MRAGLIVLILASLGPREHTDEWRLGEDFQVTATWSGPESYELHLDGSGNLRFEITGTLILLGIEEPLEVTALLSPEEVGAVRTALEGRQVLRWPEDLSSPPYYVDEATAVIEVRNSDTQHVVRASGLDRAATPEAVSFRELFCRLYSLVPEGSEDPGVQVPAQRKPPPCR